MFNYLKYKKELRVLNKYATRLDKDYTSIKKGYLEKNDLDEGAEYELSSLANDQYILDMRIEHRKTLYFKSEADSFIIPMPDENNKAMYTSFNFDDDKGDIKILTTEGIHYLRNKIREEKKKK